MKNLPPSPKRRKIGPFGWMLACLIGCHEFIFPTLSSTTKIHNTAPKGKILGHHLDACYFTPIDWKNIVCLLLCSLAFLAQTNGKGMTYVRH
jgi:hypothetical protein